MARSQLHVGIPVLGGQNWVAGKIYCHNLLAACTRCDHATPLEMTLLEPGFRRSNKQLTRHPAAAEIVYYSHIAGHTEPMLRRLGKISISQVCHPGCRSLERAIRANGIDVVFPGVIHRKHQSWSCPQIFWVPDFQYCHLPEFFPGSQLQIRQSGVRAIFESADRVILSSRNAQADAQQFYPEYRSLFRVLPFVIVPDPAWFAHAPDLDVHRQLGIDRPYLMFPSQFWMHKNHSVVFKSIQLLKKWKADLLLVCTGRQYDYRNPTYFEQLMGEVAEMGLERNLILTGLLSRDAQIQLMRQAKAIVQPSLFEGWSALLEDTRMLGKPVFVSDLPIHREQDPPDAFFFPPDDAEALADLIRLNWEQLPDGFDSDAELQAVKQQQERGAEFIRNFFAIVDEFLPSHPVGTREL